MADRAGMQTGKEKQTDGGKLIYENPLSCREDVEDFVLEGKAELSFPEGHLRMENALSAQQGQKANYVLWCPKDFPADVRIEWDFLPIRDPGLCILFFSAKGRGGEDLFDPSLGKRTGEYPLYHHGDINAFHVSYFRRKEPDERQFHTCNLRKSYGFYLVAQGADPIPDVSDAKEFYHLALEKNGRRISFAVNGLTVFSFEDDGKTYGPCLEGGKIGFRQLAPLVAEYANLKVYALKEEKHTASAENYKRIANLIREKKGLITMEECAGELNYHPSYIWKILKKNGVTFTELVHEAKILQAALWLETTDFTVAEIAERLHYANTQNFIRFFSHYRKETPGEFRRRIAAERKTEGDTFAC